MKEKRITLSEIAKEIDGYLKKFESDPEINKPRQVHMTHPYFYSKAYRSGNHINVVFVVYQGSTHLSKAEALGYLSWLRSGKVGNIYAYRRDVNGK